MARPVKINASKFKVLYRYLVKAAMDKRCVPYIEVQNILGFSWQHVGFYAGAIGDYCRSEKLPLLNALIISSTNCQPSEGFRWYQKQHGKEWGAIITECWKYYRLKTSRIAEAQNFSGVEADIDRYLHEDCPR